MLWAVCTPTTKAMGNDDTPNTLLRVGFIHSIQLLEAMPEKAEAEATLQRLSKKYEDELAYMQNDYNKKYADFMTYQRTMGENIKIRRMQELTDLENQISDFIKVSQQDIEHQENVLLAPLRDRIQRAIQFIGMEYGFTCIYDKASSSVAFITPSAIDLQALVLERVMNTPPE